MMPCPILERAGGIWQFKNNVSNQSYAQGTRYATGLRNVVGLDWNTQLNQLFVMQHGRDQLHDLFPKIYTPLLLPMQHAPLRGHLSVLRGLCSRL